MYCRVANVGINEFIKKKVFFFLTSNVARKMNSGVTTGSRRINWNGKVRSDLYPFAHKLDTYYRLLRWPGRFLYRPDLVYATQNRHLNTIVISISDQYRKIIDVKNYKLWFARNAHCYFEWYFTVKRKCELRDPRQTPAMPTLIGCPKDFHTFGCRKRFFGCRHNCSVIVK